MTITQSHINFAHAIAAQMRCYAPVHIDFADLQSTAEFGLVQAANSFDDSRNVTFNTFAYYRIRGAILDFLRETARIANFERQGGNSFEDDSENLADAHAYESYYSAARADSAGNLISFDTIRNSDADPMHSAHGLEQLVRKEQQQLLRQAMDRLPHQSRQLLYAYYFEGLTLAQIGAQMGLSKSWMSRLQARSISLLRDEIARCERSESNSTRMKKVRPFPVSRSSAA